MELVPDSQDVCKGGVQEGASVADTSDWCSGRSRNPPNSWCEEEKSNLKQDSCVAGEKVEKQEGWAEEQKGGAEDTCDCDSKSHSVPWSRTGVQETCCHEEQSRTEREVEAGKQSGKVQGDGQHWTTGGEPLVGVEARGEGAAPRAMREPRFEEPRVER